MLRGDAWSCQINFNLIVQDRCIGELDERRPLDHGAWGLLHIMYPEADIPTVSMSISPSLPLDKQYEIGKALRELKENNVLIIGSGGIVHNFTHIQEDMHVAEGWAIEFENWVEEKNHEMGFAIFVQL
ncbi:dioxygenase [[Brevibacterium] frigoritolerans]|uniref:Dioxygenase n=1 Tax=Peribacillus frigoritolerans TaxID=450367 RepID=A0A941J6D5_9BACI|nr:dioxygenase [Peribacillus frigoritolerans]